MKPWTAPRPLPNPTNERKNGWKYDWWKWRCSQIGISYDEV